MSIRNGKLLAHGREWTLYERHVNGVIVLFMSPKDQTELDTLNESDPRVLYTGIN